MLRIQYSTKGKADLVLWFIKHYLQRFKIRVKLVFGSFWVTFNGWAKTLISRKVVTLIVLKLTMHFSPWVVIIRKNNYFFKVQCSCSCISFFFTTSILITCCRYITHIFEGVVRYLHSEALQVLGMGHDGGPSLSMPQNLCKHMLSEIGLVMLKLFTGEELLWSGTTVGDWACPADVLESIFIDGYRNWNPCNLFF